MAPAPACPRSLVALLSALALVAARSGWVLPSGRGTVPAAASPVPVPRMSAGELPQAALGPASAALGAAEPSYHVHPGPRGAHALNRGQGFAASFAAGGLRVSSRSLALAMHTTAAGFGASPAPVAPVRPQVSSNRVAYDRAGMQEWYTNGPFGLEQGFTVQRPSAGSRQGGVYTVTMALSSTAGVSLGAGGRSLLVRSPSGGTLRYGGLRATDAANRLLPSWLSLSGATVSLHVRTTGARFPVSIDPLLTGEGLAIELGEATGRSARKARVRLERRAVGRWRRPPWLERPTVHPTPALPGSSTAKGPSGPSRATSKPVPGQAKKVPVKAKKPAKKAKNRPAAPSVPASPSRRPATPP